MERIINAKKRLQTAPLLALIVSGPSRSHRQPSANHLAALLAQPKRHTIALRWAANERPDEQEKKMAVDYTDEIDAGWVVFPFTAV